MRKSSSFFVHLLLSSTLFIPAIGHSAPTAKDSVPSTSVMSQEQNGSKEHQVSLNQATAEQLAEVMEGIGLKKAQNIISYREKNGPFASIEQLQDVPGIGIATMERNLSRLKL